MNKYVCIHGHFYQPPRENPWLNHVEVQESAYPYHDWNERITAECYARNAASRIQDGEGRILDIVNNYARISFNFGPTLLSWMEQKFPDVYASILTADQESQKLFSGHGSAIAQVYNHMIMPLANDRDKHTQVYWGIKDFEHRFGRYPEGMWLAETAVDTRTLEILADHKITFTILSPYQAHRMRKIGDKRWKNASGGRIDPKQPYLCHLPSGKQMALFFYDGPVSQAIAFEKLLENGEAFSNRLIGLLKKDAPHSQLAHIATDGETYGHHHRFGEMALSYALHKIQTDPDVQLTIYGEYLEKHPPYEEVEILENTSWSCMHGVERWRSDCGCHSGQRSEWNQKWRAPLRAALDWLRDEFIIIYEQQMQGLVKDPWRVRNEYIDLIVARDRDRSVQFLDRFACKALSWDDRVQAVKLLEMQHHAMLMYTSCGWFFDEVTGIETMQDIFYAARGIQLAKEIVGKDLEAEFVQRLRRAPSNIDEHQDAGCAYEKFVKPACLDLLRVGAHYAVSSIFSDYPEQIRIYSYTSRAETYERQELADHRLVLGTATIHSDITLEEQPITFAIVYMGDHNIIGGVRKTIGQDAFRTMSIAMTQAFQINDIPKIIKSLDKHFETHNYSFWHLFRDQQKQILEKILSHKIKDIEQNFQKIYSTHYPMMQILKEFQIPIPKPLKISGEFVVNAKLRSILETRSPAINELKSTIDNVLELSIELDQVTLNYVAEQCINRLMQQLLDAPDNTTVMEVLVTVLEQLKATSLILDLWKAQSECFIIRKKLYNTKTAQSQQGDAQAQKWLELFHRLLQGLYMKEWGGRSS